MVIKAAFTLVALAILLQGCNGERNNNKIFGHIEIQNDQECNPKNEGYICVSEIDNSKFEYRWKDNRNGLVYRQECKTGANSVLADLQKSGLSLTSFELVQLSNPYTQKYFEYFNLQEFCTIRIADTLISGVKGKEVWTFNWEISDYENRIVDSLFSASNVIVNDTITLKFLNNELMIDNWTLGKDNFETFPQNLKSTWLQDSDHISEMNGTVHSFRTTLSWGGARQIQRQLEKQLGPAKVVVNTRIFSSFYIWEWNDGIILLKLDKDDFNKPKGKILIHSGKIDKDEFLNYY
jgi:hypothetical protein